MLISLLAVIALSQSPEATPVAPVPVTAPRAPVRVIAARAPTLPDGPTRVVCSRERAMDTNISRRVCREVPVNSSERERMASDMLKDMQRLGRLNSD
ncbi:hypothetical protein D8I30_03415 [Brevundimonas naejangsanensis]|uniref:UrcA family protein n=1 Tax=Brevundimonas naejangsanensis TaxID=588932 RepID=A0A494RFX2_9CAUL|nr:hypothetical protein [Brevundimonas naejangsanensis]AYG94339.1 hypothetical protein D8I30_03415 [Brevundimonas naejangsanensis]